MTVEIEHVMTYIKVVELGSFTSAAYDMNISKSVVSKHVSTLEASLNTKLLMRTTRKLSVTDVGKVFYDQVKNIPYTVQHAQLAIEPFNKEPHGLLKVISPTNFMSSFKSDVVPNYLSKYPKVKLDLQGVRPVEAHVNAEYDVIILWKFSYEQFADYNLVPVKLFSMPIDIYAAPSYLAEHGTPQTPDELKSHNCFSSAGNRWPFCTEDGTMSYVDVDGRLETKNDEVVHAACQAGTGIAYSYPFVFESDIKRGVVQPILQDYTHLFIELYAFYHPTPYLPPKISAFLDELKTYYRARQEAILARAEIAIED